MKPSVGKPAPAFTLETDAGNMLSLKDLKGKTVVLYFYPVRYTLFLRGEMTYGT